jgi:hypothetical protein
MFPPRNGRVGKRKASPHLGACVSKFESLSKSGLHFCSTPQLITRGRPLGDLVFDGPFPRLRGAQCPEDRSRCRRAIESIEMDAGSTGCE